MVGSCSFLHRTHNRFDSGGDVWKGTACGRCALFSAISAPEFMSNKYNCSISRFWRRWRRWDDTYKYKPVASVKDRMTSGWWASRFSAAGVAAVATAGNRVTLRGVDSGATWQRIKASRSTWRRESKCWRLAFRSAYASTQKGAVSARTHPDQTLFLNVKWQPPYPNYNRVHFTSYTPCATAV